VDIDIAETANSALVHQQRFDLSAAAENLLQVMCGHVQCIWARGADEGNRTGGQFFEEPKTAETARVDKTDFAIVVGELHDSVRMLQAWRSRRLDCQPTTHSQMH